MEARLFSRRRFSFTHARSEPMEHPTVRTSTLAIKIVDATSRPRELSFHALATCRTRRRCKAGFVIQPMEINSTAVTRLVRDYRRINQTMLMNL